jgi:hypothetical protein
MVLNGINLPKNHKHLFKEKEKEKKSLSKSKDQKEANNTLSSPAVKGKRELVVLMKKEVGLKATAMGVESTTGGDVNSLSNLLASEKVTMQPLFGVSEAKLKEQATSFAATTGLNLPDLTVYYQVQAPDERLDEIAKKLAKLPEVEAAYVKPPAEPAVLMMNTMQPSLEEPPTTTPDFTLRQDYLNPAPTGIDALYAWSLPGGRGAGVKIIDVEWAWNFQNEDLTQNQGGCIAGSNTGDDNHGTAVLGEFSGDNNSYGITGIASDAFVRSVSLNSYATSQAIKIAADQLNEGDIILLEVHRPGPASTGIGQYGYIAIEWWPDDYDAIRYAVTKGVIIVEAGGNGGQNLDAAIYNTPAQGFPGTWKNPFNVANPSSGAVLVGAGNPPPGTHNRNKDPDFGETYADRARCFFSNYGLRVDVQGWGWDVTSTGYGDLQGGSNKNQWYTDKFSGTSSASPIIVGTLACIQGVLRAKGRIPLSPARAIELLRGSGSSQQAGPIFTFNPGWNGSYPVNYPARPATQRIGNRPNLQQLITVALQTNLWVGVQFTGTLQAGQTQRWFTYMWPAHWHVVWTVVPTTPKPGNPQITWSVAVERSEDKYVTYWISITNLTNTPVNIEARYAVLGW